MDEIGVENAQWRESFGGLQVSNDLHARLHLHRGEGELALARVEEVLKGHESFQGRKDAAWMLRWHGRALLALGRFQEAQDTCRRALTFIEGAFSPGHRRLVFLYVCSAEAAHGLGDRQAAKQDLAHARELAAGPDAPKFVRERLEMLAKRFEKR